MSGRKPHPMAFRLDVPCACGSAWGRPGIDRSDPEAMEYPVIPLCARCKARLQTPEPAAA